MGGYVQVSKIIGILIRMALKVWAYSGLLLIFCLLTYYFYGGLYASILLFFWFTGMLYHVQDNFLFYPELPTHSRIYIPIPSTFGLSYESVQTRGSDGTLIHMYFIHQPKERQKQSPTIVFFHGNAGNMGHRLQNCAGLYHNLHCNILLVEYRGYGLSEGSPTEEGLYIDARASLDYLYTRNDINLSEIIVFGRSLESSILDLEYSYKHGKTMFFAFFKRDSNIAGSLALLSRLCATEFPNDGIDIDATSYVLGLYLQNARCKQVLSTMCDMEEIIEKTAGGAVAIDLATKEDYANKIWCLVVENTFTSIPDMAKVLLGWKILQYLPLICYKNKFLSYQKVKRLRVPTLFISGMADTLVPPRMMSELHNRCSSIRKQLLQLPLGTHNETWTLHGYYRSLALFLQNCRIQTKEHKPTVDITNEKSTFWNSVQNI